MPESLTLGREHNPQHMSDYSRAESVQLIFSGENYFKTLEELILSARKSLHLQTYIIEGDETGSRVCDLLAQAAAKGVKVIVLADAYGSKKFPESFRKKLCDAGVLFRMYSPFFSSESIYFGRRLHHKVVVADRETALVGGINIADKYRGTGDELPWLDYAVLIKGEVCAYLDELCRTIYERRAFRRRKFRHLKGPESGVEIRFRRNDWVRKKNEIHKSYREYLLLAERSVTFAASYFLPGYFFRKGLRKARKRGVEINLILAGRTDVPMVRYAERFLYRFLLRHGIRIFEWKSSVMHGKAVVVDRKLASIGSYNLNYLSHYRSIELNVDIRDADFASSFSEHLAAIRQSDCVEIKAEDYYPTETVMVRLRNFFAYTYIRFMMKLFIPRGRHYQA